MQEQQAQQNTNSIVETEEVSTLPSSQCVFRSQAYIEAVQQRIMWYTNVFNSRIAKMTFTAGCLVAD